MMNLAVPEYLNKTDTKREESPAESTSGKQKGEQVFYRTPPKRSKGIASSPKPPPSQTSTLPSAGACKGAGMKSMGVASSAAKSTLPFAAPSSSPGFQHPVTSESQDHLKSLCVSRKNKMIEIDGLLDSKFSSTAKDNVLGGLSACGLTVEEGAFKNIKSIPNDSFFRNFIPYFPQFKQQEPGVAAHNICKLLCAFMAADNIFINFRKFIFQMQRQSACIVICKTICN